jgi:hypothetical protein
MDQLRRLVGPIGNAVHDRWNFVAGRALERRQPIWRNIMGRGILLWLLGVPIPIIILLALFWR